LALVEIVAKAGQQFAVGDSQAHPHLDFGLGLRRAASGGGDREGQQGLFETHVSDSVG
jgi:hypothetical protein